MYFETVLDVMRHNPFSEITTNMIKLVGTTIDQNMPKDLFENNISRVIQSQGLDKRPQAQQVTSEKIEIDFSSQSVMSRLYVLLECIKLANRIITELHSTIKQEELELLILKLNDCHRMAADFNNNVLLRYLLWRNGYNAKSPQLPSMYKIERVTTESILLHLNKNIAKFTLEKEEGVANFNRYAE
jgi:hypothetical protein